VLRDDNVVLDPDASPAFEVQPRLDSDYVAGCERVLRLARHPGRLMHLEAEAVPESVAEQSGEWAALDDISGRCVGVDSGLAGPDRFEPSLLSGGDDRVRVAQVFVERSRSEGARVVRGVAPDRAAGVDDHRLAATDLSVGCPAVR